MAAREPTHTFEESVEGEGTCVPCGTCGKSYKDPVHATGQAWKSARTKEDRLLQDLLDCRYIKQCAACPEKVRALQALEKGNKDRALLLKALWMKRMTPMPKFGIKIGGKAYALDFKHELPLIPDTALGNLIRARLRKAVGET